MVKIFDINETEAKTLEDVVNEMYKMTSKKGRLLVTLLEDVENPKYFSYLECEMNMDYWNMDKNYVAGDLRGIAEIIREFDGPVQEADSVIDDCVVDNYFEDYARIAAMRIARLCEISAPDVIVENEMKRFAYYWILNRYCDNFRLRVFLTKSECADLLQSQLQQFGHDKGLSAMIIKKFS